MENPDVLRIKMEMEKDILEKRAFIQKMFEEKNEKGSRLSAEEVTRTGLGYQGKKEERVQNEKTKYLQDSLKRKISYSNKNLNMKKVCVRREVSDDEEELGKAAQLRKKR